MAIHSKKLTSSVSGHTVKVVKHHCHLHVMKFFSVETKKLTDQWNWTIEKHISCSSVKQFRNKLEIIRLQKMDLLKVSRSRWFTCRRRHRRLQKMNLLCIMVALRITCGRQFADAVTYPGFWVFYVYICVKMHCFCFVTNNRQSEMADHTAE